MTPRVAQEIAGLVMHAGRHVIRSADALQRDAQQKITQSLAELQRPAKPGHELFSLGWFEKDVSRIELNHCSSQRRSAAIAASIPTIFNTARCLKMRHENW